MRPRLPDSSSAAGATRPRVAVVLSHPVQYYSPWFRWIATHSPVDLRVFYLWDAGVKPRLDEKFGKSFAWDVDLLSGYESEFVPNLSPEPGTLRFGGLRNPDLLPRLRQWRPDAILLFGYAYRTHLGLLGRSPAPIVFRGDSHLLGQPPPSLLKRTALRWIYARCAAITHVGQANRDYFRAFGVPESKLFFAPHCVDADRFRPAPDILESARRLRAELGLDSRRVLLFAGKLIRDKGPLPLLRAFASLDRPEASLVFVGDGPEKSALLDEASRLPAGRVHFLPFANQSEMPVRYAAADAVTLPSVGSYETWGLAVNEAMQLGRPCLVSNRVGCQRDLVIDGETGWVFDANSPASLRDAVERVFATSPEVLRAMGARAATQVAGYSYERAAAGLVAAVHHAINPGVRAR